MELLGIPYFTFRDLPLEDSFILQVYANRDTFANLHFQIEESKVSIFSTKYPGCCLAKWVHNYSKISISLNVPAFFIYLAYVFLRKS